MNQLCSYSLDHTRQSLPYTRSHLAHKKFITSIILYDVVVVIIIMLTFACIAIIAEPVAIVAEAVMGAMSVVADLLANMNTVTTLVDI